MIRDPEFRRPWEPVPTADLERLEARLGAKLPQALRDYLLKHGGGAEPRCEWLAVPPNDFYRGHNRMGWVHVYAFLRFDANAKLGRVDAELDALYGANAAPGTIGYLPFCGDSGDLVFIALREPARGRIFWGTRAGLREGGFVEGRTLCPAARNLDEFLGALRAEDELPPEVRAAL